MLSHRYACYNVYQTKDGRYLSIGALENRFWKELCEFFQVPEYTKLQYDEGRRKEIIEFFRTRFKQKTLKEWESLLEGKDICWASVRHMEEAVEEPLFKEREMVAEVQRTDQEWLKVLGTPVKLSRTPGGVRSAPPDFGEHTERILSEIGYYPSDIKELKESGAV